MNKPVIRRRDEVDDSDGTGSIEEQDLHQEYTEEGRGRGDEGSIDEQLGQTSPDKAPESHGSPEAARQEASETALVPVDHDGNGPEGMQSDEKEGDGVGEQQVEEDDSGEGEEGEDEVGDEMMDNSSQKPEMPQPPGIPGADGQEEEEIIYSQEEIESFKNIFDMFDKEKKNLIEIKDLQSIMASLNRDPTEVEELLQVLGMGQDGQVNFEEFLVLMQQLEKRMFGQEEEELADDSPRSATEEERAKYGSMLPRTGVHFLPDSKVVDFLRLLDEYRRKCEKDGKFQEAKRARKKFEDLQLKETLRQQNNMRIAQEQELLTVENAQKQQFIEFSQAWDNYMSDYEATAYLSLEKLKEKHLMEIQQLHDKIRKDYRVKMKFSKDLIDQKKRVRMFVNLKQYDEAEQISHKADALEQMERMKMEEELEVIIQKQEEKLRLNQQKALSALLKRIQRDRNEQLKHRQLDSQRLIQRNKNLLLDLLKKQNMEIRRTTQFLKFALGTRSPKIPLYYKPRPKNNLYPNTLPQIEPIRKTLPASSKTETRVAMKTQGSSKRKGLKENQNTANNTFMTEVAPLSKSAHQAKRAKSKKVNKQL